MELSRRRKQMLVVGAALGGVLVAFVVFISAVDWNLLKRPIERVASAHANRAVTIEGDLRGHLWSRTPSVTVEGLRIANPSWDSAQPTADIQRLTIEVQLSQLLRGHLVLRRVELIRPQLYLHREKSGRANWTFENTAPSNMPAKSPAKWPAVQDLTIEAGTLELIDEIRHLKVKGTIEAHESAPGRDSKPFEVRTQGTINAEPFKSEIQGGPLIGLTPGTPYPFSLLISAGSNEISVSGRVLKPFDLGALDLDVTASGRDLAELYYLTQIVLPNSPPYRLQAHIQRAGLNVAIAEIRGKYGRSDMAGKVDIDASRKRPHVVAELVSKHLFLDDFAAITGTQAGAATKSLDAHAPVTPTSGPGGATGSSTDRVFPTARLQVDRLRTMDADVQFRATSIEAGKVPFTAVSLHAQLKDGRLNLDPLKFVLPQGQVAATVHIDARSSIPKVHIDGRMTDIQLEQFKGKGSGPAPMHGTLQARGVIDGNGDSVHALMAAAKGSLTIIVPQGEVRAALPELTGIDVPEGVLLLLGRSTDRAQIRCGVVHFDVFDGHANADNVVIDTQNVLITGHGQINLDSEALDLTIQGHPKKLRLFRVRSPVELRGTLARPAIRLEAGSLARQGGVAVALGTLLTPLAALLAFVDPGLAKDQNCTELLASASQASPALPAGKFEKTPPK